MNQPYYIYRQFMIDRYGEVLQRIPIDPGFGCPNRNADGSGGCLFCAEDGGRAIQTRTAESWREQIDMALQFARDRYGAQKFMGYCQAYSGTHADYEQQANFFRHVLDYGNFTAFTIGTRPDCLPPKTLELFKELAEKTDLWIELGVQTVHNQTLAHIRRGHTWEVSRNAIQCLSDLGISCAVHLIFGLPGEDESDWHATAQAIAALPIRGIKFHNLHIIKGTALAAYYSKKPFPVLDEHDYAEVLIDAIARMPPDIPVMRLQTDTPSNELIAPRWQMKKGQFTDYVAHQMRRRGIRQGDLSKI